MMMKLQVQARSSSMECSLSARRIRCTRPGSYTWSSLLSSSKASTRRSCYRKKKEKGCKVSIEKGIGIGIGLGTRCYATSNWSSNGTGEPTDGVTHRLKKGQLLSRLSVGALLILLSAQVFTRKATKLARHLNSHEFCCYLIVLLLLNVPTTGPLLLKPFHFLFNRKPALVEELFIGRALSQHKNKYKPSYEDSMYKGLERSAQVGLISMTMCRLIQKSDISNKAYKALTGKTGCLLKELNAVEVAWIVSVALLLLKFITVMYNALDVVNANANQGSKQLRVTSMLKRTRNFLRSIVSSLTVLIFADSIGLPIRTIWTSLGFITIALGLASQELAKNFIGGMNMIFFKPFEVGDRIKTNDIVGVVTDIGLIHTKVRGLENEVISSPNSAFTSSNVVNYSTRSSRILQMTFGLSKPDNIDKLLHITAEIQTLLTLNPNVQSLNQKPRANISDISLKCYQISIYCSINAVSQSAFAKFREEILAQIYRIVKENGGEFAFDTEVVGMYVDGK